jgi:cytoskeleton protein RodZ
MSDLAGGRGGAPMWASEPRQQAPGDDPLGAGRTDSDGYGADGPAADGSGMEGPGGQTAGGSQSEVDESDAQGPGALLAAERSAQGLGVGDIARQLKLSVRQVEALERDDYDAFAGMVFVRGFLRNYAKLLDLDPEPLVAMTHATSAAQPATASPPVTEEIGAGGAAGPMRGWLLGAVVLIVLVVAAIFEGRQREAPRRALESAPAPALGGSPQHAESPPPGSPPAGRGQPAAVEQAPAVSAEQAPLAAAPINVPAEAAPAAVEPAAVAADATASAGEKQLRLEFDGAAWVEIKDAAGAVIFSRLNDAGTAQVVQGRAPLSVVIGNAHSVRLSYGDRPVDLSPHIKVDVARLVLE